MREGEFKEWMQVRRLQDTTISTQMSKARKLDRYFGDLDKHISDGTIDAIAAKLADPVSLPSDLGNPGERNHLAQSLRYYREFANSNASGATSESDADRIRRHALENYIEPVRAFGQRQIDILVSDVNRALGLRDAWPNICQALAGKKFQELARVPSPMQIGADMSSATIFRFDVFTAALSNDNILARLEENSPFKAVRQGWNAAQTEAFCDVARTVHDLGLDWWHVNVSPWQLRFGRKSTGRSHAEAVLGILLGSPPRIDFKAGRIGLGQNNIFALTPNALSLFSVHEQQILTHGNFRRRRVPADGQTNTKPNWSSQQTSQSKKAKS